MRYLAAFLILLFASPASAGWCNVDGQRVWRWQTIHSLRGWNYTCYRCHSPNSSYSDDYDGGFDRAFDRALGIAEAQVRSNLRIAERQAGYAAKMNLLQAFGLVGSLKGAYQPQGGGYAQQGATLYGYGGAYGPAGYSQSTTSTYTENWGQGVDLMVLYQALGHAADSWRDGAHGLAKQHGDLVARAVDIAAEQSKAEQIRAQGEADARRLAALPALPSTNRTVTTTTTNKSDPPQPVNALSPVAVKTALSGVIVAHCAECHGPKDPKGGLTLTDGGWTQLTAEEWGNVRERVHSADHAQRMPKGKAPLPAQVLALFDLYQPTPPPADSTIR